MRRIQARLTRPADSQGGGSAETNDVAVEVLDWATPDMVGDAVMAAAEANGWLRPGPGGTEVTILSDRMLVAKHGLRRAS